MDPTNQRLETGYEPIHVDVWRSDFRLSDGAIYTKFFTDSMPWAFRLMFVWIERAGATYSVLKFYLTDQPVNVLAVTLHLSVVHVYGEQNMVEKSKSFSEQLTGFITQLDQSLYNKKRQPFLASVFLKNQR